MYLRGLTNDDQLHEACRNAGGEPGQYIRSPGGYEDTGCKFDETTLFFDTTDPMTGRSPKSRNGAFVTVETDGHVISGEYETYQVGDGPQRLDLHRSDDRGSATFTGSF